VTPSEPSFPFIGAGDADYFEYASLGVLFERPPSESEQRQICAHLPAPLSAAWSGALASLASEYGVRAAIVAHYGRGKRVRGDERTMGSPKMVAAFNRDIERWLDGAHAIVPIRLAVREPDGEAGGTRFDARHRASVEVLLRSLPAWRVALDAQVSTPELGLLHAALDVLLDDTEHPVELDAEWREWFRDVSVGDWGTPGCALRKAIERSDVEHALALLREQEDLLPYLPTLYGVGQVPTLRPPLARLLAALGPGVLPADLGTVVLLAWAEADLADGTLPLEEARRALDAWREALLTDAGAGASLPGLLHAMLRARSYLSARRVADFAVLRRDLHPSTYANALFVAQATASGLPVDRALDERLLAACLPHAPSNPAVYVNAACLYLELGALDDAHRALAQALVHGRNEPVRNVLGSLLFAPHRDDPRFADLRKVMDAP
jgi:hypothetical protein